MKAAAWKRLVSTERHYLRTSCWNSFPHIPVVIRLVSVAARHHLWRLLRQWEADVDVEPGETVLFFVLLYTASDHSLHMFRRWHAVCFLGFATPAMPSEGNLNLDLKVCENWLNAFYTLHDSQNRKTKKEKFPTVNDSEWEALVFVSQNWIVVEPTGSENKNQKTFWVGNRASTRSWLWNHSRPRIKWHNMRFNERWIASRGTTEIKPGCLGVNHAIEGLAKTGELRWVLDTEKVLLIWSESSDLWESLISN